MVQKLSALLTSGYGRPDLARHAGGRWFKSNTAHYYKPLQILELQGFYFFAYSLESCFVAVFVAV